MKFNHHIVSRPGWLKFPTVRLRDKSASGRYSENVKIRRDGVRAEDPICWNRSYMMLTAVVLVFLAACSGLSRDKRESPDSAAKDEARAILSAIRNYNAGLKSFKGDGKIKVWQQGRLKFNQRVLWVGAEPAKISIVVLIGGYPAVKMANDGKWFYYYEAGQGNPIYKKVAASKASLKHIFSISIKTTDVLSLLAGRIPIRDHHLAILEKQETPPGYVLVLKKRWWGTAQKIYLNESVKRAHQVEFFNRSGSLIYRARLGEMQPHNGYLIPAKLSITNGEDADFELKVDRFWSDVAVKSSMFILTPPE